MKAPAFWRWAPAVAVLLLAMLAGWAGSMGGFTRLDNVVSDWALQHNGRTPDPDIVIVAIDDESLASVGQWPWPRDVHARLLNRLSAAMPAAIGIDLLLSERAQSGEASDAVLAQAMAHAGNVVLPVTMYVPSGGDPVPSLPLPEFSQAAAAIGHVHYELDSDGMLRSTFLREGVQAHQWDHLALALLRVAGKAPSPERGLPGLRAPPAHAQDGLEASKDWLRDHWIQIPFAGPPGHFRTLSYADVLAGRFDAQDVQGKIIVIGATAAGMRDSFPTPVSGAHAGMAGAEISANLVDALKNGVHLRRATAFENAIFNTVPGLLALLVLRRFSVRLALPAILGLLMAIPVVAVALHRPLGITFAPMAGMFSVALAYPVWSWSRLELAMQYLSEEFQRVRKDAFTLGPKPPKTEGDQLDQRIQSLQMAAQQFRSLHHFVRGSLNSVPDTIFVTDARGSVTLANLAAASRYGVAQPAMLHGLAIDELLARQAQSIRRDLPRLDSMHDTRAFALETREDSQDDDLLVKGVPRTGPDGELLGWIVSMVDIASVREVQRRRDEALRFISHDIRAPQSSILTLIELRRGRLKSLDEVPEVLDRIEGLARQSLKLAEDFLHLAKAESGIYIFELVNLSDLVLDAADQLWVQSTAAQIRIETDLPDEPVYCPVERSLFTRVIVNLLSNAIKYSATSSVVHCSLRCEGGWVAISVRDQGVGIEPHEIPLLFQRFRRLTSAGRSQADGAGLGLTFVKAVVTQHKGQVDVSSQVGRGTEFRLRIPLPDQPLPDDLSDPGRA
jgi:CHASE2 domain-containing sensor protein/signal transduction histidine kinase